MKRQPAHSRRHDGLRQGGFRVRSSKA